jgi:acetylornithine aminotransferase
MRSKWWHFPLNRYKFGRSRIEKKAMSCVIIEPIQGVGGLDQGVLNFYRTWICKHYNAVLILDEVQSGFGRSGKFFAHQFHDIKPDIICMAKEWEITFLLEASLSLHFKTSFGLLELLLVEVIWLVQQNCSSRWCERQNLMANASKVNLFSRSHKVIPKIIK